MRLKLVSATCLLFGAGAAAVGASSTFDLDGNNRVIGGSDTVTDIVHQILANTPGAVPGPTAPGADGNSTDGTYYAGGGSGVGSAAMAANTQQIGPASGTLSASNYCKNAAGTAGWIDSDGNAATNGTNTGTTPGGRDLDIQGTTQALVIALDGLSVYAHVTQAASGNSIGVQGKTLVVHHYIPDPTKARAPVVTAGSDKVTASSKTWVIANASMSQRDITTKITVTGSATTNGTFTIASVTNATTFITLEPIATGNETFGANATFSISSNLFVVDTTTPPTTAYGAATDNGDNTYNYVFNSSVDVLRVLYAGLHHGTVTTPTAALNNTVASEIGTFDAGSDVRRSLADSFGSIFTNAVPNPTHQLNHLWRRSDLSGTTGSFAGLIGVGSRAIGTPAGVKTNPYVNSGDANGRNPYSGLLVNATGLVNSTLTSPLTTPTATSPIGPGDFTDFDPIRRPALVGQNPNVATTSIIDLEQVSSNDGTLGLLLPVFTPDVTLAATIVYPTRACTAGAFDLVSTGYTPANGTTAVGCPQGNNYSGLCFIPFQRITSGGVTTKHYACLAKSQNPNAFAPPVPSDNRVFNLAVKDDATGGVLKDFNGRFMKNSGFYRAHVSASNTLVTPGVVGSGLVLAGTQLSDTFQEGALVGADPFTLAYGGRGIDTSAAVGGAIFTVSVSGSPLLGFDPTAALLPSDQNVKNLVIPSASPVYPLARRLYINTLVGFCARGAAAGDGGAAVFGLTGEELALARAFENSDHVGASAMNFGFIPLPSLSEGFAANGVFALDYPEDQDSTTNALTKPLPGCGATTNRNAVLACGPDSITQYSMNGSSPPFPTPWPPVGP